MATPLPCDNHPGQLAVILTTNLEAGETLTLCWPCTLEWAAMLVGLSQEPESPEQVSEPTAEEVADLEPVAPAPDTESKTGPEPAPTPATQKKHRAKVAQETTPPGE